MEGEAAPVHGGGRQRRSGTIGERWRSLRREDGKRGGACRQQPGAPGVSTMGMGDHWRSLASSAPDISGAPGVSTMGGSATPAERS